MACPQTRPAMLLLYLAFKGDWVSRDALATLFQPNEDDASARKYLRVLLNRAKDFAWAQQLEVSAHRLRWLVQTDVSLLLGAFEEQNWALVCQLHQKTLLEDFTTRDAPAFEAWCELERAALTRLWQQAAMCNVQLLTAAHQPREALRVLEQLLRFDSLQEDVVVASMRAHYALGHRQVALGAFEAFRKMLHQEMGLEPMPETLLLHGKMYRSEVLEVSVSRTVTDQRPSERLNPVRFVGREAEQRQLLDSQKLVRVVIAEAGAGKTRLLEQSVPAGAAWWRCREGLSDVAYHPITEWIRTHLSNVPELGNYFEDLARLIPEIAPTLVLGLPDPITAKTRLLEAITRVFEVRQAPLVIDDLQWIDQSSLEALIFMVANARVTVVIAARSDELTAQLEQTLGGWRRLDQLLTVKLEPLAAADAKALLDDLIGLKVHQPHLHEWLVEHCGGNVFFMLETIRDLLSDGNLAVVGGLPGSGAAIRIPQSVAALIEARLARRSEIAQRVLQASSVLREGLSAGLLASMVGISEFAVVDALEEAERSGFISRQRFQHDLMRQSVYNSISDARRSALHARAATVLEPTSANFAVLSEHWHLAGNAAKAFTYLNLAAEDFYQRGLFAESLSSVELVIQQAPDADSRLEAQQKRAWLLFELAHISQAKALNALVLREAQQPLTRAYALHLNAVLLNHEGDLKAARASNAAAMELMQSLQPDFVLFHATAASIAHASGDYAQAMDYLGPAVLQLRKQAVSTGLISCLNGLGAAHSELKNPRLAEQYCREAWQMARSINAKSNQVAIAVNLAYALGQLDRLAEALQIEEEALSLGEYAMTNTLRNNVAQAYLKLGRTEEAKALCHSILADATDATLCCVNWMRLAKIHDLQNRAAEKHQAVQNGIESLQNTEYEVARAAIAVGVLNYGTDAQIKWLEQFLSTHAFASQMLRQRVEQTFTVKYGHSDYTF